MESPALQGGSLRDPASLFLSLLCGLGPELDLSEHQFSHKMETKIF